MRKKPTILSIIVRYFILPLSLFALFKKSFDWIFGKIVISPFLSSISPAGLSRDISIGVLCLILLILFFGKVLNGAKIPLSWALLSSLYIMIYFIYRTEDETYKLTSSSFSEKIKLADFVLLLPLTIIVCFIVHLITKRVQSSLR